MKILIDSNVLISAALSANGTPYRAFIKAVTTPNKGCVCDQNIDEIRRIFNRKFPHKLQLLEQFLSLALTVLEVIPTPATDIFDETLVRDPADRPILRAAVEAKVDIILTGDKDFLEAGLKTPTVMTPADFVEQ